MSETFLGVALNTTKSIFASAPRQTRGKAQWDVSEETESVKQSRPSGKGGDFPETESVRKSRPADSERQKIMRNLGLIAEPKRGERVEMLSRQEVMKNLVWSTEGWKGPVPNQA